MPFRVAPALSPVAAIRALVCEHYGVKNMPLRIVTREEEIEQFESDHPEVPPVLWDVVNHNMRLLRMWARLDLCVDLVVWWEASQTYRLVQDICFRDAFPTAEGWRKAVYDLITASPEVWVVTHLDSSEDAHPSPNAYHASSS